jgi:hypothetical protein
MMVTPERRCMMVGRVSRKVGEMSKAEMRVIGEMALVEALTRGIKVQFIPMGMGGEDVRKGGFYAKHRHKRVYKSKKSITLASGKADDVIETGG